MSCLTAKKHFRRRNREASDDSNKLVKMYFPQVTANERKMILMKKYYAVKNGYTPGVYPTWDACKSEIYGYSGAVFKAFPTLAEAQAFLGDDSQAVKLVVQDAGAIPHIYVDGSYSDQLNQYGWSFVVVENGSIVYQKFGTGSNKKYLPSQQVGGEVVAVLQALGYAIKKGYKEVCICYDYVGIEKWATGEWQSKKAIARAYVYYLQDKFDNIEVSFKKVKAHSGNQYNNLADSLAKRGATQWRRTKI